MAIPPIRNSFAALPGVFLRSVFFRIHPLSVFVVLIGRAFAAMTALLAWLSHRLIESPFIRLGKALTATARTRAHLAA